MLKFNKSEEREREVQPDIIQIQLQATEQQRDKKGTHVKSQTCLKDILSYSDNDAPATHTHGDNKKHALKTKEFEIQDDFVVIPDAK